VASEAEHADRFAQVDSLSRIFRYIFWVILLGGIVSLLRSSAPSSARPDVDAEPLSPLRPMPLFRDPICGTYVSAEISLRAASAGQDVHFCSQECRDRYLRSERQAASA
jgi:YHS domain-containing protein